MSADRGASSARPSLPASREFLLAANDGADRAQGGDGAPFVRLACTYVVTTRPGAVEPGWLSRLSFREARVEPMSRADREEFIDRWYKSAAIETRHRPRPGENLTVTAERLKSELADQTDLAALATNPLLCAMICALYRERQESLPESPSELCDALCQMLLHRHQEHETPDLTDAHFVTTWRELQYGQKRALSGRPRMEYGEQRRIVT